MRTQSEVYALGDLFNITATIPIRVGFPVKRIKAILRANSTISSTDTLTISNTGLFILGSNEIIIPSVIRTDTIYIPPDAPTPAIISSYLSIKEERELIFTNYKSFNGDYSYSFTPILADVGDLNAYLELYFYEE